MTAPPPLSRIPHTKAPSPPLSCCYSPSALSHLLVFSSQDHLDIIIGDLDSLTPAARAHFSSTRRPRPARIIHDRDQESTDFGKAVHHIRARNNSTSTTTTTSPHPPHPPLDIVAVGGLGGRVDQALSLLHHLHLFQADPAYAEGRLYLVSDESLTFLLKTGRHRVRVRGAAGDAGDDDGGGMFDKYVGIVPVGEPSVISTSGLEWDVTDWRTEFGGRVSTSNHVLPETEVVEVRTTKDVLFTIALKK